MTNLDVSRIEHFRSITILSTSIISIYRTMDPRWSSHNNTPSLNSWNPSGQTSTPTDTNPQSSPGMPSAFLRPQATPSMRSGPSTLGGIHAGDTSGLFGPTPFQGPRHTTPAMMILPSSSSTVQQQQQQHQQGQPPFGSTIPAPSTQSTQIQRPTGYTGAPKRVDLSGVSYQEVLGKPHNTLWSINNIIL